MTNNDILRRLRFTFDLNDDKVMDLFRSGGIEATRAEISDWMKKEEDEKGERRTRTKKEEEGRGRKRERQMRGRVEV